MCFFIGITCEKEAKSMSEEYFRHIKKLIPRGISSICISRKLSQLNSSEFFEEGR